MNSKPLEAHPEVSVIYSARDRTRWAATVVVSFAGGNVRVYGSKNATALRSWLEGVIDGGRVTRTAWEQDGHVVRWQAP